jgi:cell division protein FtsL
MERVKYANKRPVAANAGRATNGKEYIYGNTVPDIKRELDEAPRKKLSATTRKNREKAHHMSLGYVVFLVAALCACAIVLINYVQLQAELTAKTAVVAELESDLNHLKLANDEEYNRITSSIDLEEIKRIAIGELGMTYAKEGQIITYTNNGTDYMRQASKTK